MSHLLQMRGLKLNGKKTYNRWITSHLLQMRGLKQKRCATSTGAQVASFTDAWIETIIARVAKALALGRIFYRCVD